MTGLAPNGPDLAVPLPAVAADMPGTQALSDRVRRLESRFARERRARLEAEHILEARSRELFAANVRLEQLAADLERRVEARTSELAEERQRALMAAERDGLTGIANRSAFNRRLEAMLDGGCMPLALLLIDLDEFKRINDTLGHPAGDALLIETGARLRRALGPEDAVARLGGDEFAMIVRADRGGAIDCARRLLTVLSQPVSFEGRQIGCRCSIGVALADVDVVSPEYLLRNADLALYHAKRQGRARLAVYEPGLRESLEAAAIVEARIQEAVRQGEIEPWFQPVWSVRQRRFQSVEMLARWRSSEGCLHTPDRFIGTVEQLGLLDPMLEGLLQRALPVLRPLVRSGHLDAVCVNLSASQFNGDWVQESLPVLLDAAGFPASAVILEVTENALVQDVVSTRERMQRLVSLGIRFAIDDFGVGYSNFSVLRQLPFHYLKLDRSLVQDVETDAHARAVIECITGLAARLSIDVVGEGVETEGQRRILQAAGCAYLQGFLLARPAPDVGPIG